MGSTTSSCQRTSQAPRPISQRSQRILERRRGVGEVEYGVHVQRREIGQAHHRQIGRVVLPNRPGVAADQHDAFLGADLGTQIHGHFAPLILAEGEIGEPVHVGIDKAEQQQRHATTR